MVSAAEKNLLDVLALYTPTLLKGRSLYSGCGRNQAVTI